MMIKKNQSDLLPYAKSNKECFYCDKKKYYKKECHLGPKRKLPEK